MEIPSLASLSLHKKCCGVAEIGGPIFPDSVCAVCLEPLRNAFGDSDPRFAEYTAKKKAAEESGDPNDASIVQEMDEKLQDLAASQNRGVWSFHACGHTVHIEPCLRQILGQSGNRRSCPICKTMVDEFDDRDWESYQRDGKVATTLVDAPPEGPRVTRADEDEFADSLRRAGRDPSPTPPPSLDDINRAFRERQARADTAVDEEFAIMRQGLDAEWNMWTTSLPVQRALAAQDWVELRRLFDRWYVQFVEDAVLRSIDRLLRAGITPSGDATFDARQMTRTLRFTTFESWIQRMRDPSTPPRANSPAPRTPSPRTPPPRTPSPRTPREPPVAPARPRRYSLLTPDGGFWRDLDYDTYLQYRERFGEDGREQPPPPQDPNQDLLDSIAQIERERAEQEAQMAAMDRREREIEAEQRALDERQAEADRRMAQARQDIIDAREVTRRVEQQAARERRRAEQLPNPPSYNRQGPSREAMLADLDLDPQVRDALGVLLGNRSLSWASITEEYMAQLDNGPARGYRFVQSWRGASSQATQQNSAARELVHGWLQQLHNVYTGRGTTQGVMQWVEDNLPGNPDILEIMERVLQRIAQLE